MVILITGKAGAGKTEYGTRLANELHLAGVKVSMIDGDEFRQQRGTTGREYFTDEERLKNLLGAAEVARDLECEGCTVVMAFIAPRTAWRDVMRSSFKESRVVYIPGGNLWEGTTYETPTDEELQIRRKI